MNVLRKHVAQRDRGIQLKLVRAARQHTHRAGLIGLPLEIGVDASELRSFVLQFGAELDTDHSADRDVDLGDDSFASGNDQIGRFVVAQALLEDACRDEKDRVELSECGVLHDDGCCSTKVDADHDTSPSVGAGPAVEGAGLAVVEPMDGDDSAVVGTAPSGASRAEGVGAAGASAAPTPDSHTFFECPSCGWVTGVAGASLDPDEDRELLEQWEEDVQAHATECAERLHPRDEGTVVLPMAVFKKLNPHTGVPGMSVRCPQCRTSYWFERTKHGRKMLAEAIADHMDHTRVGR